MIFFYLPFVINGQTTNVNAEVNFERDITNERMINIIKKAKKEGKYVFVYINFGNDDKFGNSSFSYEEALRCEFSNKYVAEFLNNNFINVLIEPFYSNKKIFEIDPISNTFLSTYNITYFPQCIFFDENGYLVHRFPYGSKKGSEFINKAVLAYDRANRYSGLIEKFESDNTDSAFISNFFNTVNSVGDDIEKYVTSFIRKRNNLFNQETGEILINSYSNQAALDYIFENHLKWKKVIDENKLINFYKRRIYEQISRNKNWLGNNWMIKIDSLINWFENKYPNYGKKESINFFIKQKLNYSSQNNLIDQDNFIKKYLDSSFISKSTKAELNTYAWYTFLNSNNKVLLESALLWSYKSLEIEKNPAYLDTYANLLYKLGQINEAIEVETNALELAETKDKKTYQETLEKMKNGEKTWR